MTTTVGGLALEVTELSLSAAEVTLTGEVSANAIDAWRRFDAVQNSTLERGAGGDFRTIPRGDPVIELSPDATFTPPFVDPVEGVVVEFSETQLTPTRYELRLSVQRMRPRLDAYPSRTEAPDRAVDEAGADEWVIELNSSRLALGREQVTLGSAQSSKAGEIARLRAFLDSEQAAALADTAGLISPVVDRGVPDAVDIAVDTSADGRHTLTVNPAAGETSIRAAEHLLRSWRLTWRSYEPGRRWALEASLSEQQAIALRETLRVESGETLRVESGETRTAGRLVVEPDATLTVEPDGRLTLTDGQLHVRSGETETIGGGERRVVSGVDVEPDGSLTVETNSTLVLARE